MENKFSEIGNNNLMMNYKKTDDIFADMQELIETTQKLILQPIVENCIEHAFPGSRTQNKKITIKSYIKESGLVFEVSDNGIGIPLDKLNIIRNNLIANKIPETKHIGICNVNQRIKLIFGENYGLTIHSDSAGTKVKLVLPANI